MPNQQPLAQQELTLPIRPGSL